MKPNIHGLKAMLKTRGEFPITGHFVRLCGFTDMRDFFEDIHQWGYTRDFTYDTSTESFHRFIRKYLRERFIEDNE